MSATWPARQVPACSAASGRRSTLLAIVISSPSRIQATPSAITSRVWNFDHGSRSIRAGIRLRMFGLLVVGSADVVAMRNPLLSAAPSCSPYPSRDFSPLLPRVFRVHALAPATRSDFERCMRQGPWRWENLTHIVSSVNDVSAAQAYGAGRGGSGQGRGGRVARSGWRGAPGGAPRGARLGDGRCAPSARSELLRLAARRPGIGVAEAAQELRLAPNSVSTMVSKLAADGLLNRGRVEADGRSVRLTVTEAGAARVEQWKDIRSELAGRALERLSPADRKAIGAAVPALGRLAEQMEEL